MSESIERFAVIGLGLIGSSFAAALRQTHPSAQIFGVDASRDTVSVACYKGWVNQGCLPEEEGLRQFIEEGCDLVLLAVPVDVVRPYFQNLKDWGYEGLITDTASTKARIVSIAEDVLGKTGQFLPGHPMCGSEKNGIEGANPAMFSGAYWILCPDSLTLGESYSRLHTLFTSLGSRVINIPREDHDNAVAIVSHVPHIMASSQVTLACNHVDEQRSLFRLAAGGFKDSTRIAAGSPKLWTGIVLDNAGAIASNLHEMQDIIGSFLAAIESQDRAALTELLSRAAEARRALPASWVPSSEKLFEVRVPMQNRSGVVAEVTTIASKVGCNIQSIDIDHVTESTAFLSLVLTDEGDIGKLSTELLSAGYTVSFAPLSPKEHVHVDF